MLQRDVAIAVLLSPGFEEGTAVYCLDRFRDAGFRVALVGMTKNPIRGMHGISVQPDCTIDEISANTRFRLVILSGGQQYISSMLVDPRVYNLFQGIVQDHGFIAPTKNTEKILKTIGGIPGLISEGMIISQGDKSPLEFAELLLNLSKEEGVLH